MAPRTRSPRHRDAAHRAIAMAVVAAATLWAFGSLRLLFSWEARALEPTALWVLAPVLTLGGLLGLWLLVARGLAWRRGAWDVDGLLCLRVAVYGWFLAAVVFLAVLQPFDLLVFHLTMGTASAGILGVLAGAGPLSRWLPHRALRVLDIALANLVLVAALLEVGLRVAASVWPSPLLARESASVAERLRTYRLEPGSMRFGFPVDERGFYDRPPGPRSASETLVAAIGDSFSVGIVPHVYHYTTEAERQLPWCEIYNIGVVAVGPEVYLHLLRYYALPLRPDAVVICLFVGNDIVESTRRGTRSWLREWFDRDNLLALLVAGRVARIAAERAELGRAGTVQGEQQAVVGEVSDLVHVQTPWFFDPALEEPTFSSEAFLGIETARARAICGANLSAYDRLFADLAEMRDLCGATPMHVVLIPDEFQVEDGLWTEVTGRLPGMELDRDQPQRLIGGWLTEKGIAFLDLLPALRAVPPLPDGNRHLYHIRDTHLNVRGNRVAGESLAAFLARLRVMPEVVALEGVPEAIGIDVPGVPRPIGVVARLADGTALDLALTFPETRVESRDPSIVGVLHDGTLHGVRIGSTGIEIRSGTLSASIPVRTGWPPVVDLGGGTPGTGERVPQLRLVSGPGRVGATLELSVQSAARGAAGTLWFMDQPALGGILPHDARPYAPATALSVPLQVDGEAGPGGPGSAIARVPIPDTMSAGTVVYCAAVFEDRGAAGGVSVSNVLALTLQ